MRTPRFLLTVAALIAVLAGCSPDAPEPGPRFDDERQAEITCMRHQVDLPGARYTSDTLKRTDETLGLLRYYTAHGRKKYCDGAGPTEADRAWAGIYVRLGADRDKVATILR